jgi:hypothetical protein
MKLKEFNRENTMSRTGGGTQILPRVSINFKNGLFRFSKTSIQHLGLSSNQQWKAFQDQDNEEDWYIEQVKDGGFIIVEREKKNGTVLGFSCSVLARKIADSVSYKEETGRLLIATHPVVLGERKLWKIDTNLLRNK